MEEKKTILFAKWKVNFTEGVKYKLLGEKKTFLPERRMSTKGTKVLKLYS